MAIATLVCALACAGCSSDSHGGNSQILNPACMRLATARCEKYGTCNEGRQLVAAYGESGTCVERVALACSVRLSTPKTNLTSQNIDACATALVAQTCEDWVSGRSLAVCDTPPGTVPLDGVCIDASQCANEFCWIDRGAACGTCRAPPQAGQPCADTRCGEGLVCVLRSDSRVCEPTSSVGESCGEGQPMCAHDLSCLPTPTTQTRTCQPKASTVGAPCTQGAASLPDCNPARWLFCADDTDTCQLRPVAIEGESCSTWSTICRGNGKCVDFKCLPSAPDGAACDAEAGPNCLSPARCIQTDPASTAGTCQVVRPEMCM